MSSPHTPGGSGRQGNNSPEVGAGDGPPQYRVAFPQPMAYQESASSAHVGRRSYTHNGYAGSSPQPPSRSFPAFPTMPMEDPLEPSSSNDPHASNDVGSCLHLLLSLADELARFRIEDIRNAALTHDEPDGVLRTVRMVSVFCSEIETALQNRTGRVNTLKGKGKAPAVLSTPPLFSERLTPTPHSAGSTDYYPANEHYHAAERPVDATFGHDPIEPAPVAGSSDAASAQDTNVYTCYHEVVADPSDELAINIKLMDRVKLDIEMDDGLTGIGTNLNTGAMGSFPLSCIVVPDDVDTGPLPRRGPSLGSVRGSGTATSSPAPTRNSSITGHSAPFIPNVNLAAAHAPSLPEPVLATPVNDVTASPVLGPSSHAMHLSTADGLPRTGSVKSLSSFHSDGSGRPMSGHLGGSPWGAATGPEEYPAVGNQQPLPVRAASIQSSSSATSKADVPPTSHTPSHTAVDATGFADPKSRLINPYANLQEHSQPPPLSAQVIEKRKFARQVVTELYETEKNFRDGMQILIDQFMVPLAQCIFTSTTTSPDSENAVITKMEHSMLFRNIPGLRNLSKKICGLLKDALDRAESDQEGPTGGGAVTAVVDVFLSNVEFEEWSTYVRYMEGYAHAKQTLTTMKKRVAFTTMLERCESAKECNRYTFDHYMILPVQRIGRYHLLLGRLKKVTDEEDPVHQAIETAEQYMKQIGDVLESVQKQEEELRRVFSVFQEIKGCPPDIISASRRRLLSNFEVDELFSGLTLQMHVFSDCLLLSIDPRSASISASISALSSHASSSGTSVGVRRASTAISHMYNTGHGWMGNANASSPALSNTTSAASSASALLPNGTPAQHRQRGSGRGQTNGLLRIVSAFAATSGVAGGGSSSKKQQQQPKHTLQFVIRVTLGDLEVESVGTLDDERIASLLPNASRASERSSSAADSTTAGRIVVLRHLPGASSRDKQVKTPDSSNAPPISRHSSAPETVHNHVSSSHPSYDNYTNTSRPASIHGTLQQSPSTPSPHHNNTHTSLPPPITTTRPQHPQTSTHPGVDRSASGYFTEADRSSSLASPRPMSGVDGDDHHAAYAGGQADAEEQEMYAFRARNSKRMAGLLAALGLAGVGVMKP